MNEKEHTKEYISMAEAANICTYDQEYLSLLARRGLLQAEKIGKKWYTTRHWLNDYLRENRPNEIIKPAKKVQEGSAGFFGGSRIFKWSLVAVFAVVIVGIYSYWYIARRINQLEQKTNGNKFILNEVVRIPDDQGNMNVYGSGMVKINEGAPLKP
jgi:hypothetical protein